MKSILFVLVMGLMLLPLVAFGPTNKYKAHFGEAYPNALKFCEEEAQAFQAIGKHYDLDPKLMAAIVFPELMRFNAFQNFFETEALELAYVQSGSQLADFSIGYFQMKPSFAEFLEAKANEDAEYHWAKDFQDLCSFEAGDLAARRAERLKRLQDTNWQLTYLAAFIKYSQQDLGKETEALRLLATRYNCGPQKNSLELKKWLNKKTFPYGPNYEGNQFNYSQIALDFHQNIAPKIFKK